MKKFTITITEEGVHVDSETSMNPAQVTAVATYAVLKNAVAMHGGKWCGCILSAQADATAKLMASVNAPIPGFVEPKAPKPAGTC